MVEDVFVYCDTHFQLYIYQQKELYMSPCDSTAFSEYRRCTSLK